MCRGFTEREKGEVRFSAVALCKERCAWVCLLTKKTSPSFWARAHQSCTVHTNCLLLALTHCYTYLYLPFFITARLRRFCFASFLLYMHMLPNWCVLVIGSVPNVFSAHDRNVDWLGFRTCHNRKCIGVECDANLAVSKVTVSVTMFSTNASCCC